jgi:hypothetical protein
MNDLYNPSRATVKTHRPQQRSLPMYVISGLIAIQLLATFSYGGAFFELVRVGAVRPLGLLLGVPASICLYFAVVFFSFKPHYSKRFFAVAATGLSLSAPFWWRISKFGTPFPWSMIVIAGALLAAAGWWFSRQLAIKPDTDVRGMADD